MNIADLEDIYVSVFGEPPSAATRGSLLAMAYAFQITDNDPLGPVIVMMMRSADQIHAALSLRSDDEKKHFTRLRDLTGELSGLIGDVIQARAARWKWKFPDMGSRPGNVVEVAVSRRASPMLNYLAYAFMGKNGVIDRDDRISAARFDMGLLIGIVLTSIAFGAAVAKVLLPSGSP